MGGESLGIGSRGGWLLRRKGTGWRMGGAGKGRESFFRRLMKGSISMIV